MQQSDQAIEVSVVLPVYNEADHLEEEVRRIQKALMAADVAYEIIIVDDGSIDGFGALARLWKMFELSDSALIVGRARRVSKGRCRFEVRLSYGLMST